MTDIFYKYYQKDLPITELYARRRVLTTKNRLKTATPEEVFELDVLNVHLDLEQATELYQAKHDTIVKLNKELDLVYKLLKDLKSTGPDPEPII